jgi:hypothetical protein
MWKDIISVIPCEHGLDNIELLINEIKNFDIKSVKNDFWFLLSDGALIAPQTKRVVLLSSSFNDNWWYLKHSEVSSFVRELGFMVKADIQNRSVISMVYNDSLLENLSQFQLQYSNEPIPIEISNRQAYLKNYLTESLQNAEEIIQTIFEKFSETKSMEKLLVEQKNNYLENFDTDIRIAKDTLQLLVKDVHDSNKKKLELTQNIEKIELSIHKRVSDAVKKSKTNFMKVFDEPLAQLFFNSVSDHKAGSEILVETKQIKNTLPNVRTLDLYQAKDTYKLNGVKLEENVISEGLFEGLKLILEKKGLLGFRGSFGGFFVSTFLNYLGHQSYNFSKLLLADEVSYTSRLMLQDRNLPLVVFPTDRVNLNVLTYEIALCTEVTDISSFPIIFCVESADLIDERVMCFDCDKLKRLTPEGIDLDELIGDIGNEYSSIKTKKMLKHTNNNIREWYLLSINSSIGSEQS